VVVGRRNGEIASMGRNFRWQVRVQTGARLLLGEGFKGVGL
jgi:hypothetical protein